MMTSNPNSRTTVRVHPDSLRCSIENCETKPNSGKQIYPIPSGPTRCLWIDVIRRHNKSMNLALTDFVCSDHFSDDQKLPNGHLKGNAVPSIFPKSLTRTDPTPITCQFCHKILHSRKELIGHDRLKHWKEYNEIRIKMVTGDPEKPRVITPCSKCRELEQVLRSINKSKANMRRAIETLEALRNDVPQSIKLDVDFRSFLPTDLKSV